MSHRMAQRHSHFVHFVLLSFRLMSNHRFIICSIPFQLFAEKVFINSADYPEIPSNLILLAALTQCCWLKYCHIDLCTVLMKREQIKKYSKESSVSLITIYWLQFIILKEARLENIPQLHSERVWSVASSMKMLLLMIHHIHTTYFTL